MGPYAGCNFNGYIWDDTFGATTDWLIVTRSNMTISNVTFPSGNVGVGTINPTSRFHVLGTSRFTGVMNADTSTLAVPASGTTGGTGDRIILSQGSAGVFPYSVGVETNGLWMSVPTGASHRWYVNGVAQMQLNNTSLTCIQDVIAFGSVSDEKLKENIVSIPTQESLDIVNSLHPVRYRWKNTTFNERYRGKEDMGFIAQEVERVLPDATIDTMIQGEEYKTIRYERILPMLVGAIKELTAKYEDLKSRVMPPHDEE
jgi:hypothetical protein